MAKDSEYKEKTKLPRLDIANRLRLVADGFEYGSFRAGDLHVTIPQEAQLEMEIEPQGVQVEIKWK